jgi:hypothetical protein
MERSPDKESPMPTLNIPEDTYARLAARAKKGNVSVEDLVRSSLAELAQSGSAHLPPETLSYDEWKRRFDAWQQLVRSRAGRYPPGFRVDDSRESIYGEREDAQR